MLIRNYKNSCTNSSWTNRNDSLFISTKEYEAKYCYDPGMKLLGKLHIDLPVLLTFGKMELTATSKNELTDKVIKQLLSC